MMAAYPPNHLKLCSATDMLVFSSLSNGTLYGLQLAMQYFPVWLAKWNLSTACMIEDARAVNFNRYCTPMPTANSILDAPKPTNNVTFSKLPCQWWQLLQPFLFQCKWFKVTSIIKALNHPLTWADFKPNAIKSSADVLVHLHGTLYDWLHSNKDRRIIMK